MPELLEQPMIETDLRTFNISPDILDESGYLRPEEQVTDSPDGLPLARVASLATTQEVALDPTLQAEQAMTLKDKFLRSRIGRLALTGLAALGLAGGMAVLDAAPAFADSGPVYTVVNPDHDGTRSIYDRNSPSWADSTRKAPDFSYYGDRLQLICGTNGEAVGPYNNRRWHYAQNLSRPEAGFTWIPDRYLNTPNKANQATPGEGECGAVGKSNTPAQAPTNSSTPKVKACYFNLKAPSKNITFSYGGDHRYLGNAWQAAKNWTNAGAGISITSGNSDTAYIWFKDIDIGKSWVASTTPIPETQDWMGPNKSAPIRNPHIPKVLTILINKKEMDRLNNFQRTYVLTHEIGHTLGLGHPDQLCGYSDKSVMEEGDKNTVNRTFNTPTNFDKMELRQLYGQ